MSAPDAAAPGAGAAPHRLLLRVYYEDTDFAGLVYHANYLKFIERARSEWVRSLGIDQGRLLAEAGCVFAVRRLVADYRRPARFDDVLRVETRVQGATAARLVLMQDICRGGETLFAAEVTLVCLGPGGAPVRLPAPLRAALRDPR